MRLGWTARGVFGIRLHKKDRALLELIQAYFNGVGNISKDGKDYLHYYVSSLKDLTDYIIPHFDKYPLITQKLADYLLFKQVVEMLKCKEHLTLEGLRKALSIKASSNLGLSEQQKFAFPNISPVKRPKVELPAYINPYWLAGFTSAEGCFSVYYSQSSSHKFGRQVALWFSLSQHSRDTKLMKSLVQYFDCGRYQDWSTRNSGEFRVHLFSDVFNKIIPFFQEYPIIGVKNLDYLEFCKVAKLMKEGCHLTEEGLNEIKLIKNGMNKGRMENLIQL